jgi:hypothetical protein
MIDTHLKRLNNNVEVVDKLGADIVTIMREIDTLWECIHGCQVPSSPRLAKEGFKLNSELGDHIKRLSNLCEQGIGCLGNVLEGLKIVRTTKRFKDSDVWQIKDDTMKRSRLASIF